jgi:hypothetical protein
MGRLQASAAGSRLKMSNPIARIPFVAKKRRKAKAEKGAKLGGPALAAAVAGVVALLLRRRKKGDSPDAGAAQSEAAAQDADQATVASEDGSGGADTLGASSDIAGTAPEGSVMPDTGADDTTVREATNAAADEAGAIGSDPDQPA